MNRLRMQDMKLLVASLVLFGILMALMADLCIRLAIKNRISTLVILKLVRLQLMHTKCCKRLMEQVFLFAEKV